MNDIQKQKLHAILMPHEPALKPGELDYRIFDESVSEDIRAMEPVIDDMIREAAAFPWDTVTQTWKLPVPPPVMLAFHEANQLLAFLKFHEWHETRPGFTHCHECKQSFQAVPIEKRHHRAECRIPGLIKILQTKIIEGSNAMAFPNTRKALEEHGYVYHSSKTCPSCNVTIEMWTTPKQNLMPLDFKTNEHNVETCEPHFATCKDPKQYSRRLREKEEKKKAAAAGAGPLNPDAA